jgi:hypothetical protein
VRRKEDSLAKIAKNAKAGQRGMNLNIFSILLGDLGESHFRSEQATWQPT